MQTDPIFPPELLPPDVIPPIVIPPETTVAAVSTVSQMMTWIVDFVHEFGYFGIFVMTFIESTFVPIPSEVTMVPAGYLVQQGHMNFWKVMIAAVIGTVGGSIFNYWLARSFGRMLLEKYGKYFFMTPKKMQKMEEFFVEHGAISTFSGRLLPGVRHYISFPAGLARMNLQMFCIYTALGGAIWMLCLLGLGYFIGHEQAAIKRYLPLIVWSVIAVVALGIGAYVWRFRKRRRAKLAASAPENHIET